MTYIVAELGQNHQGSVAVAKAMVDAVACPYDTDGDRPLRWKWDAIKTTKRDLEYELTRSAQGARYKGRNSFGATYGEHRATLELSWDEHRIIHEYARDQGLGSVITLCAPGLVAEIPWQPDFYKVASRDLTNGPLLEALRDTGVPVILSTGMHGRPELERALDIMGDHEVAILHCVSSYPTKPEHVNLKTMLWLKCRHPQRRVGFSDHTVGIKAGPTAVALGADILEKHVTLWRGMRGTDQSGALDPEGCWRYARDVRMAERMLGQYGMFDKPSANAARRKLERSIAAAVDLEPGTLVGSSNTCLLSPGTGIPWHARSQLFGKVTKEHVPARELIDMDAVA